MPLIECSECKASVSDQADSCPRCGFPFKARQAAAEPSGHGVPALLSLFVPGLGQLVRGQILQALAVWISFPGTVLVVKNISFFQDSPVIWIIIFWTAIWIHQVVDAYRLKKTSSWPKLADWTQPPERITVGLIAIALVSLAIIVGMFSQSSVPPRTNSSSPETAHNLPSYFDLVRDTKTAESHTIGEFKILLREIPETQTADRFALEILRDGRKLHEEKAHRITIIDNKSGLTVDGNPGMVIEANPGGAHARSTFIFFSLGKDFKVLGKIENHRLEFRDLDNDNWIELIGSDTSFDYWETSYAESPAPTVIFKYSGNGFRLAPTLMRRPAPDQAVLLAKAEDFRIEMSQSNQATASNQDSRWASNGGVPVKLWGYMLDLIFTGNGDSAWAFFHRAWPESKPGKKVFFESFRERLSTSEFWPQVMTMNGWKELPDGEPR